MTLTMQSLMVVTLKTMRTSCDTGSITTALSPSRPSEMQLYLLMLSSAILENLNYLLPPSFCFNDQRDYTREHPVSSLFVHTYGIAFSVSFSLDSHTHTLTQSCGICWVTQLQWKVHCNCCCCEFCRVHFLLNVAPVKIQYSIAVISVVT